MSMQTKVSWSWELPEKIDGTAIVCDAWAATTNISTFLSQGVANLFIVNVDNIEKAAKKYPQALKVGESQKLPEKFFDISNFPHDIAKIDLEGKTILYMSNNGSRVIELAFRKGAKQVITVSFVNMKAVVNWLKGNMSDSITLVASGEITPDQKALEDYRCVEALDKLVKGNEVDWESVFERTREYLMQRYPEYDDKRDRKLIFDLDRDNVVPLCQPQDEGWIRIKAVLA